MHWKGMRTQHRGSRVLRCISLPLLVVYFRTLSRISTRLRVKRVNSVAGPIAAADLAATGGVLSPAADWAATRGVLAPVADLAALPWWFLAATLAVFRAR